MSAGWKTCDQQASVIALAAGALDDSRRGDLHEHLLICGACREVFRDQTRARFPYLPHYTILEQVGQGGFGRVYKAIHHEKGRFEALKILNSARRPHVGSLQHEVQLCAQLHHPSIATLYECQLDSNPPYYAMEYVDGVQLNGHLRGARVTIPQALALFRKVAEAVGYAHSRGVVHRDLKPQNVLITHDGEPRLVDFGIGKRVAPPHAAPQPSPTENPGSGSDPVGTLGYMSPEQLIGQHSDARADIYSLGALLFHMLTGQSPRTLPHGGRLARLLQGRRIARPADLSAVIDRCTADSPGDRYPDCGAVIAEVDRYAAGKPVDARAEPGWRESLQRAWGGVLQNYPRTVFASIWAATASGLTFGLWNLQASQPATRPTPEHPVLLVQYDRPTLDAVEQGLLADFVPPEAISQKRLLRRLHARLIDTLSEAGARAIILDYYFPACEPAADPRFSESIAASRAPVVVGAEALDENAEPTTCRHLRPSLHDIGMLAAPIPDQHRSLLVAPLVLQRGQAPLFPSLALAAYTAARRPDCKPHFTLTRDSLEIRYRRNRVAPGEPQWEARVDRLPVADLVRPMSTFAAVHHDDRVAVAYLSLSALVSPRIAAVSYLQLLSETPEQRRERCRGRVVIVGQTLPGLDQTPLADGRVVYGCHVHAAAIDSLLSLAVRERLPALAILARLLGWGSVAAVAVRAMARRADPRAGFSIGTGILAVAAATSLALVLPFRANSFLVNELALGAVGGLLSAGLILLVHGWKRWDAERSSAALAVFDDSTLSSHWLKSTDTLSTSRPVTPSTASRGPAS